jgi:DNA-binding CsgD family transcriptional regulator
VFRTLGDRLWRANALNSLGLFLCDRRAFGAARSALEEALALYRSLGGARRVAIALLNLGDLARAEGDRSRAEVQLRQSLELFHELQDAWNFSIALEGLAQVAADACETSAQAPPATPAYSTGQAERAAELLGAAEIQREEAGVVLAPVDRPAHDHAVAVVTQRLGSARLAALWLRGRSLARDAALPLAQQADAGLLHGPQPARLALVTSTGADAALSPLTEREREVAALVASGLTNKQIADTLVITKLTADKHVGNILSKVGVASRAQVAVWWVQHVAAIPASSAAA